MGWFKIGDLFTLQMGKTPARSNSSFWGNGHIWVSISDLSNCNKYIASSRELITDDAVQESGIRIVPQGTLIMSFKLSLGKTAITASNLYTNEAIMAFIDKKIVPLDINYVYHLFNNWDWSRATNKAVMGLTLNKATLSQIKIPIPSLNTQKAIANILDKIDESITLRKRQLEIFNQLVKSRFLELFGDPNDVSILSLPGEKKSIEDVCDGIYGGGTPSKSHKEYYTGKIPWVTPKDMKTLSIDDSQNHINSEAIENSTAKLIPKRCVLMVIRSGILKHTLPVAINNVEVTINQDMKAFVPSSLITPEYLLYTFKLMEKSILSKVRGVTADNIEFSEFRKRRIVVPPIEVQTQFVDFALSIDKSKMAVQKSLDELETLKKSLMQTYFG